MKLRTLVSVFFLSLSSLCAAQFFPGYAPGCDSSTAPTRKTAEVLNDTQGVDFGPYLRDDVLPKVKKNWYSVIPPDAMPPLSKHGCVVIGFKIMKDGSLARMRFLAGSGDVALDRAAFGGVTSSAPFSALPEEFKGSSIELRFKFFYNPPRDTIQGNESSVGPNPFLMYTKAQETASPAAQQYIPTNPSDLGPDRNVQLGKAVRAENPSVPKSLRGKQATAVLGATIEPDGTFADLWALGGDQDFEDSALDVVHKWQYTQRP
jgi:TonB family protein